MYGIFWMNKKVNCIYYLAWPEKGASKVKIIKTDLRNRLKNDMLEGLMHLTVNGPDLCTDQVRDSQQSHLLS
jgi:hypothetical protein